MAAHTDNKSTASGLTSAETAADAKMTKATAPGKSRALIEFRVKILIDGKSNARLGVALAEPADALKNLVAPDDVVIPRQTATLVIDYPLSKPDRTELKADVASGITRLALARAICKRYAQIYMEEEAGTTLPVETCAARSGGANMLLNRASTDGPHGIWGHSLDDLILNACVFDAGTGECTLSVDS